MAWGPFKGRRGFPTDEAWREANGWDEPAPVPLGSFDCPRCSAGLDENCPICRGEGRFLLRRWPTRIVPPKIWRIVEGVQLLEFGFLPAAGGWVDQAQLFQAAARILMAEKSAYEAQELD